MSPGEMGVGYFFVVVYLDYDIWLTATKVLKQITNK